MGDVRGYLYAVLTVYRDTPICAATLCMIPCVRMAYRPLYCHARCAPGVPVFLYVFFVWQQALLPLPVLALPSAVAGSGHAELPDHDARVYCVSAAHRLQMVYSV